MIENCTIYLREDKIALKQVFKDLKSDGGLLKKPTYYEYEAGDGLVRLNVLPKAEMENHLRGFAGYIAQLPNSDERRTQAQELVSSVKYVFGVILPGPVEPNSMVFQSIMHLINLYDGFVFVGDSVLMANGEFLVGSMAEAEDDEGLSRPEEPELLEVNREDCKQAGDLEDFDPEKLASREDNYYLLAQRGFDCAKWLPLYRHDGEEPQLRSKEEVAKRVVALKALFAWVSAPEDVVPTAELESFIEKEGIKEHLTEEELEILELDRETAHEEHVDAIGWRLENMWALAWVIGYEKEPLFYSGQLPDEVIDDLLNTFLPRFDKDLADFLNSVELRAVAEVDKMEDLFYCTHNAVRSALLGKETVPKGFHPVYAGGAIHERRHSLTWSLSSGVEWNETDLST